VKEIDFLKARNEIYKSVDFVDISAEDYIPEDNQGIDFETAMGTIHAILPDGTVVTGIPVFQKLYEAVGLGWVYSFLKIPGIPALANRVYDFWAYYRLPITGRPSLAVVLEARRQKKGDASYCSTETGSCD